MRVDLEGRRGGAELRVIELEKTLVRTYCMRKTIYFYLKENAIYSYKLVGKMGVSCYSQKIRDFAVITDDYKFQFNLMLFE